MRRIGGMTDENGRWYWFQRWTDMEARVMIENEICLRCENKMGLSHDCRRKSWALLLVEDEDRSDDDDILIVYDEKREEKVVDWVEMEDSSETEVEPGGSDVFPVVEEAGSSKKVIGEDFPVKEFIGSDRIQERLGKLFWSGR